MNDPSPVLDELIRESLSELLACYVGSATHPPHEIARSIPAADAIAATLGFTAPELRGSVVLVASAQTLSRVRPPELAADSGADELADWSGELCNQLVGRIKNKLLRFGITVTLSVPTVFSASALQRHPRKNSLPTTQNIQLTIAMEGFATWVDLEARPGVEFAIRNSLAAPPTEGELVLF